MSGKQSRIPLLIAASFIALNLIGLDRSPVVWIDEVTLNDPAKELALHGQFRSSVFAGKDGFGEVYLWQPPGQTLVTAAVYRLLGFGIWQTRVPVVLFGGAALLALYLLTVQLSGSRTAAAIAAVLFGLDPTFIQTARSGRMDAQCLFFALCGVYCYLRSADAQKRSLHVLAVSGLCVGLAGVTHPVAVVWSLAMGLLIVLRGRRRLLLRFVVFGGAAGLPSLVWLLFAMQTPDLFKAQFIAHGEGHLSASSLLLRIWPEMARDASAYKRTPLLLLVYVGSFAWVCSSRPKAPRLRLRLVVLFAVPFLFNTFFMVKNVGFYFLHPFAILAVCAGLMLSGVMPQRLADLKTIRGAAQAVALLLLLGKVLAGGIVGRYVTLAFQWRARDPRQITKPIAECVPPGSIVRGIPQVWYAVEESGSTLSLVGERDPEKQDFLITSPRASAPPGFRKVRQIGRPLPLLLGRFRLRSADYQMVIWESELRGGRGRAQH